jgi:hypothetical protein
MNREGFGPPNLESEMYEGCCGTIVLAMMEALKMSQYPRWKYSGKEALIVDTPEDEEALVGDWYDSPTEAAEAADTPDKESLLAKAAEIGLVLDKRLGIAKIQSAIDAKLLESVNKDPQV